MQDQAEAQMMLLLIPIIDGNSVGWVLRMQAIGIRATLGITITIENLIAQLPPPILLLGDFNSHSTLWGCSKTDLRGKMIEDLLLKHNLSILNNGSTTY